MGGLRRKFLETQLITTEARNSMITDENTDNVRDWITFF